MKKLLSVILCLCMVMAVAPAGVFAADTDTFTLELGDAFDDGWSGNYISVYLDDFTIIEDNITIEDRDSGEATYTFEVTKDTVVAFMWHKGSYSDECTLTIKRNDEVIFTAEERALDINDNSIICISGPDASYDIDKFFGDFYIVGDFNNDPANIDYMMQKKANSNDYLLTKTLEAGTHSFYYAKNGSLDLTFGASSEEPLEIFGFETAEKNSKHSFKLNLTKRTEVTFFFKPLSGVTSVICNGDITSAPNVTIADNTTTDNRTPSCETSDHSVSQYIIPADVLTDLKGKVLSEMTWYYTTDNKKYFSRNVIIYFQEVEDDTVSQFIVSDEATKIFDKNIIFPYGSETCQITLPFDNFYNYKGGNLLVTVIKNEGSYNATFFIGNNNCGGSSITSANNYEAYTYDTLTEHSSVIKRSFIPKTTFAYKENCIFASKDGEISVCLETPGSYSAIVADYEGDTLKSVQIVPVEIEEPGTVSNINTDINLGKGDKVILINDLTSLSPVCENYIVN